MMTQETERQRLQEELDAGKTAAERNRLGQYATPFELALDVLGHADGLLPAETEVSFLDPGFGTGVFYSALLSTFSTKRIARAEGFEYDRHYWEPAIDLWRESALVIHGRDFTKASPPEDEARKHNLVICNPPYVRHHHISNGDKSRLQDLTETIFGERISGLAGLYCYFLALSDRWMKKEGIAGWLIPSEFMDVNYGKPVKRYLLEKVTLLRIHRFDPQDVQFRDALVSSVVVWFRKSRPPVDHCAEFSFGGTLIAPRVSRSIPCRLLTDEPQWTRYPMANEREIISGPTLGDFFSVRRGLATGDNNFFVIQKEEILKRGLPFKFFRPVLPSPRFLKVDEVFADEERNPCIVPHLFLLDCRLPPGVVEEKYPELWDYLQEGRRNGVHERYLCRNRSPWYLQESRPPSPFICTYMGRSASTKPSPFRFILNYSSATVTNSYHLLYPLHELETALAEDPALAKAIWTVLREIRPEDMVSEGRIYGGGLHKIEPNELSKVPAHHIAHVISQPRFSRKSQGELFAGLIS
jgi:predicted RNA methylase